MVSPTFLKDFKCFDRNVHTELEVALQEFLEGIDKSAFFDSLTYLLGEMVGNADKANLKRAHFALKKLDIHQTQDYAKGMADFKDAVSSRRFEIQQSMTDRDYKLKVFFRIVGKDILIGVWNNHPMVEIERQRYDQKLSMARKYTTIQEVFEEGLDQTEGAGFGLIITILMLRKIGLDESNLSLQSNEDGTTTQLRLPLDASLKYQRENLAKVVIDELGKIPKFPVHVVEALEALNKSELSMNAISKVIEKDPVLIAEILRLANSALYNLPQKLDKIELAVKMIGARTLRHLLLAATAAKLLTKKESIREVQSIMDYSSTVAHWAVQISKTQGRNEDRENRLFVAGMLHDIGRILLVTVDPNMRKRIETLSREKGLDVALADSLTHGYDHSLVGAALAKKWDFPEHLYQSIAFHHYPLETQPEYREEVFYLHAAVFLERYLTGEAVFADLAKEVAQTVGWNSQNFETAAQNIARTKAGAKDKRIPQNV